MATPRNGRQGLQINKGLPRQLFNRFVTAVLRSPLHRLAGFSRVGMVLAYMGKKSGKHYSLPLAYSRQGDTVTTFAFFTNTVWWKNLRGGMPVTVRIEGRDHAGLAEVIEDPNAIAQGLVRWRRDGEGGTFPPTASKAAESYFV